MVPWRLTWRPWTGVALVFAAYVGLGFWLEHVDAVEAWTFRIGLLGATIVPLAFIVIYTVFGLRSDVAAAKWWKVPLGSALVSAAVSLIFIAWPLAWVFWFQSGNLHAGWLAWAEVCGPAFSSLAWLWVCILWIQVRRADTLRRRASAGDKPA